MATSTQTDPNVAALNAARDVAIKNGQDPYAGSLKTLGSFTQPGVTSAAPTPIAATTMQSAQTPYAIPPANTQPVTNNLALTNNAATAQVATDANPPAPVNPAKTDLNAQLKSITDGIAGTAATENQIRTDQGLYDKQQKAAAASNELDQLDKSYRDQVQAIKTQNPNGLYAGAIEDKLAQAYDRYQNNRANLALTYKVLSGDYNAAQQIVDDKISSLEKQQSNQLQAYQLAVSAVNNDLTDSEKLKAQANYQQMAEDHGAVLDAYKTVLNNAAQGGAPASVLSAIDDARNAPDATAASIFKAAGSYAQDPKYQLELRKARQDLSAGNVTITNPNAGNYKQALSVILGSGKFTKDQTAQITAAINSGQDPFTVIKNQAKNIMGQTEATQVQKYEVARDTLSSIGDQLKAFYAAGGDTNIFTGNFEKVYNKLGQVKNPALVSLATQIQGNLQVYRNAISGTAYSAQEGQDISSIFPGINKSQSLNTAILAGRKTLFDDVIDSNYRSTLGPVYDQLKTANKASEPVTPDGLKSQLQPGEMLVSREAPDGRHYVAIKPDELWATDIKM